MYKFSFKIKLKRSVLQVGNINKKPTFNRDNIKKAFQIMLYEDAIPYTAYQDLMYIIELEDSIGIEFLNLEKYKSLIERLDDFNYENLIPVCLKYKRTLKTFDIGEVKRYIERLKMACRNIEKREGNNGNV